MPPACRSRSRSSSPPRLAPPPRHGIPQPPDDGQLITGRRKPPAHAAPGLPSAPAPTGSRRRPCHRGGRRDPLSAEQQQFVLTHLGLAQQQARRFALGHGLAYEDLLGPAYEGLCKAALGFEPHRGHRPSSYVVPKVRGELLHHLRDTGFACSISHRLRELWIRARALVAAERSDADIAGALGVPLEQWLDCRLACGQPPLPLHELQDL